MKVKELIEELQKLPQDLIVVLASDEEGNSFDYARDFGFGEVDPEDKWDLDFHSYQRDEDGEEIYPEIPHTAETANAVCIWP